MPDWPHQLYAAREIPKAFEQGVRAACLSSPTGGGKSTIIQRDIESQIGLGKTVNLYTNRRLLTNQLMKGLDKAGIHVGVRAAGFESWRDDEAPVQVCSVQTELARTLSKRAKLVKKMNCTEADAAEAFPLPSCDRSYWDEAHLQTGETAMQIMAEHAAHGATQLGITATPLGIGHIYEKLIIAGTNSELRACGALVMAKLYEPSVVDIPKIRKSKTGILSQSELDEHVKHIWSQHIVGHILDHWKMLNPDGMPTLGMAPGVKESLGLAQEFWNHGINAASISSESIFVDGKEYFTTEQDDRDEIFERSKSGEIPVIWNRFVMREGVDLPWLRHLILACAIAGVKGFVQVCGRVLRASPSTGKTEALIADHCNNIRIHGSPNMDRDDDWREYFRGEEEDLQADKHEKNTDPNKNEPEPITCPKCFGMRKNGRVCPFCHYEHESSVRYVIQESGKLKKVEGEFFKKRRVKMEPNTADLWEKCYHRCRNAKTPMSFNQIVSLFVKEHRYYPPKGLPLMPVSEARHMWKRKIKDVLPGDLIPKPKREEQPNHEPAVRGPQKPRRPPEPRRVISEMPKKKSEQASLFD